MVENLYYELMEEYLFCDGCTYENSVSVFCDNCPVFVRIRELEILNDEELNNIDE